MQMNLTFRVRFFSVEKTIKIRADTIKSQCNYSNAMYISLINVKIIHRKPSDLISQLGILKILLYDF